MRRLTLALTLFAIASVPAEAGPATTSASVNFREGPGTGFDSLGTIAEGAQVDVKECDDGGTWCAVSFDGQNGFVSGKYLNDADPKGLGWPRAFTTDSGATITAISESTARAAGVDAGTGLAPVVLRTANGVAPARTGSIDKLRVGNIVARNLKIVTSPGLGGIDVIGMNFLSQLQGWRVEERTLILVPHNPQPTT